MSLDPRILERFTSEFSMSRERESHARERALALAIEGHAWNDKINEEQEIQQAINDVMVELGEAPLS